MGRLSGIEFASVEREYEKHKKLKKCDVENLLKWVHMQPHLPKLYELEVMMFLNACNYSVQYTKQVIDNYYTCRTHCPEFFMNRTLKDLENVLKYTVCTILPGNLSDGSIVLYMKILDFKNFNFADVMKLNNMVGDLYFYKNGFVDGIHAIMDMDKAHMTSYLLTPPSVVKKAVYYMQEAAPMNKKGIHFVNAPSFMQHFMAFVKNFVKNDVFDIMHWYNQNNINDICEYIPKAMLPKDFGGGAPTIAELHEAMIKDITDHQDFFAFHEKTRIVNESLRPEERKTPNYLLGIDGNFKRLEID